MPPKRKPLPVIVVQALLDFREHKIARRAAETIGTQCLAEAAHFHAHGDHGGAIAALAATLQDMATGTPRNIALPAVTISIGEARIPCTFTGYHNSNRVRAAQPGSTFLGNAHEVLGRDVRGRSAMGIQFNGLAQDLAEICNDIYRAKGLDGLRTITDTLNWFSHEWPMIVKRHEKRFGHGVRSVSQARNEDEALLSKGYNGLFLERMKAIDPRFVGLAIKYDRAWWDSTDCHSTVMFEEDLADIAWTFLTKHPRPVPPLAPKGQFIPRQG